MVKNFTNTDIFQIAWGQNDNLIGGTDSSDGFGNDDEGFDSFLAMKAPIQVTFFLSHSSSIYHT